MNFDVGQMIANVGVPATLCFYVLTMLKRTIDQNTKAINLLAFKMGVNIEEDEK